MSSELTLVPDDLDYDVTIQGLGVNQQVFGRYSLRRVLGRGGMGVVWLSYDERLDREVALKFLPEAVNCDPGAVDDLKRETRRCLDLTHPNIIRIYDFVRDSNGAAISMEFIDGKTLAALRVENEQRVFEVGEIKKWVPQICQALHYAHEEAKVIHRDLKPANLMLTERGQIKIGDFGIARSASDSMSHVTMQRGSSGTLAYMSPQQLNGDASRATDDIYAIGATLYEFLTSKPPFFSGDIPYQARVSIPQTMSERRKELAVSGHDIPREWEETVAACLSKLPEQRPKNMLELAERLGLAKPAKRAAHITRVAPAVAPSKTSAAPKKQPPPLPRRPFPTRRVLQVSGAASALALLGWSVWHFALWPLFARPGELLLTSNPPGAIVHIDGKPDQVTPATFPSLRMGGYRVTISQEGFDPVEKALTIPAGGKIDLGTIQLTRAFGKLSLATLPPHAHYVLAGAPNTGSFQKEGSTPDLISGLPAGSYQLTLTAVGFPPATETIRVPANATKMDRADLIDLAVATDASPDPAKVFRGEMDVGQLDDEGRRELVELFNHAFEEDLSYGFLASAADKVTKLQSLGKDVETHNRQLAERRDSIEKEIAGQITTLLNQQRFASAEEKLRNLDGVLEKESVDRLNAQFQGQLAPYQQQVGAAIKASQGGPPETAYPPLKALAAQYPNDLQVLSALSEVQTRMPPDHDRLEAQLKSFRQFSMQNTDFAAEPSFLAMQMEFANELKQLDTLAGAVAAAKNGSSSAQSQLSRLKSQRAILEKRRVGHADTNPFAQAFNFFGKVMVGHSVVNTETFFSSARQKEEAIDAVQDKIDAVKQVLSQPQGTLTDAQKQYNDFVAHVPWGQQ